MLGEWREEGREEERKGERLGGRHGGREGKEREKGRRKGKNGKVLKTLRINSITKTLCNSLGKIFIQHFRSTHLSTNYLFFHLPYQISIFLFTNANPQRLTLAVGPLVN